ncbi:MAG: ATP-binding cassette domain-containing protein [Thermodesulfobacteriota bacterium]|nr:ATP-binding cassette domain-containing protein [Thermodesulfobacteriota bacterium]
MDFIYQIRGLKQRYNGSPVLNIDRLDIDQGIITGIMGPNGSGKTTLLRLLAFIDSPWQGEVRCNGRAATPFSEHIRRIVTFLPQTPSLLLRSVYKNISYGLKIRGMTERLDEQVEKALSMVGLSMSTFGHRRSVALSGGEAQRVALAARLAIKPKVLLLDEPTANVDTESALRIKQAVHRAKARWNTTVIVVSHDSQWIYEGCDRILQMYQGRAWDAGNKNVVPGPWQHASDGSWFRPLTNGHKIMVSPPPSPDTTAMIAFSLEKSLKDGQSQACLLDGTVSRLILEKKTGRIAVSITVGDVVLTLKTSAATVEQESLYPGKQITVSYLPGHTQWIVP